jgi:hypothetical protein
MALHTRLQQARQDEHNRVHPSKWKQQSYECYLVTNWLLRRLRSESRLSISLQWDGTYYFHTLGMSGWPNRGMWKPGSICTVQQAARNLRWGHPAICDDYLHLLCANWCLSDFLEWRRAHCDLTNQEDYFDHLAPCRESSEKAGWGEERWSFPHDDAGWHRRLTDEDRRTREDNK